MNQQRENMFQGKKLFSGGGVGGGGVGFFSNFREELRKK